MFRRLSRVGFGGAVLAFTVLALIPSQEVPKALEFWDKAQHALAFAVLMGSGLLAFPGRPLVMALMMVLYGGLIEVAQSTLTTTRVGDAWDWLADSVGVLLVLLLWHGGQFCWRRWQQRTARP